MDLLANLSHLGPNIDAQSYVVMCSPLSISLLRLPPVCTFTMAFCTRKRHFDHALDTFFWQSFGVTQYHAAKLM